jgi:hypothetical protein
VEEEARKKHEEEEKRRREEEEQCECEEEEKRKRKAEEKRQCELADFKKNEADSVARLGEQKKATRAEKAAKKASQEEGMEGNKGKKRTRLELELGNEDEEEEEEEGGGILIGNMVEKDGVVWAAEDGKVCYLCRKVHRLCLWKGEGGKHVKVCLHCNENKKKCSMTEESDTSEAKLPRKKWATTGKEKGKAEEKVEAEPMASGSGWGLWSGSGDVLERLLAEIQGLRGDLRTRFRKVQMEMGEIWRTRRELAWDARDLANCFLPDNGVQGEEAENDQAG